MSEATIETGADQYLTFRLGEEQYAITVGRVREVIEYTRVTRIPKTAASMRGVINIRGSMIPVIDLKTCFGMGETAEAQGTSIVVLELAGSAGTASVGVLADSVQEVVSMDRGAIEPPPDVRAWSAGRSVSGVGKRGEDFVLVLDIDEILGSEVADVEYDLAQPAAQAAAMA